MGFGGWEGGGRKRTRRVQSNEGLGGAGSRGGVAKEKQELEGDKSPDLMSPVLVMHVIMVEFSCLSPEYRPNTSNALGKLARHARARWVRLQTSFFVPLLLRLPCLTMRCTSRPFIEGIRADIMLGATRQRGCLPAISTVMVARHSANRQKAPGLPEVCGSQKKEICILFSSPPPCKMTLLVLSHAELIEHHPGLQVSQDRVVYKEALCTDIDTQI